MNVDTQTLARDDLKREVAKCQEWYHRINVGAGVTTPGINDTPGALPIYDRLGLPKSGRGLRVLDVGCSDGFFSFEMERRGAEVTALDVVPYAGSGFAIARQLLTSKVKYIEGTAYRLDPKALGTFDIVLCFGVIYHLRSPMWALDQIRGVTRDGGTLFLESQLATLPSIEQFPVVQICDEANPLAGRDGTNFWFPTLRALVAMLRRAQFSVEEQQVVGDRGVVRARSITFERERLAIALDSRRA